MTSHTERMAGVKRAAGGLAVLLSVLGLAVAGGGADLAIPGCTDCRISEQPTQTADLSAKIQRGTATLTPRARYRVTALVRDIARYDGLVGDSMGELVPMDVVLAWGYAATPEIANRIGTAQGHRFFSWRTMDRTIWRDRQVVGAGMANTHLIPETEQVARQLGQLEEDQVYEFSGRLVDITLPGRVIKTSLTRQDTGAGSCEVLLLSSIRKASE